MKNIATQILDEPGYEIPIEFKEKLLEFLILIDNEDKRSRLTVFINSGIPVAVMLMEIALKEEKEALETKILNPLRMSAWKLIEPSGILTFAGYRYSRTVPYDKAIAIVSEIGLFVRHQATVGRIFTVDKKHQDQK